MDKQQLTKLYKGHATAQKELYYAHCDRLMSVIYRYVKNVDDAEEVLQDTFCNIFRKIKQFNYELGTFESWSYKIAINQSLMCLRKKKKLNVVDYDFSRVDTHIQNEGLENLHFEELLKKIDLLDEKYKTIILLRLIEGYEYKEISEKLNIKEVTIRKMFSRARRRLMVVVRDNDHYHLNPISEKVN